MVFINPVITPVGNDVVEEWEGCLSIPDIRGRVPRARSIKVSAFDRNGGRIEIASHDFPARVIQHETDHLDGVLFFDRMRTFESLAFLEEYARYGRRIAGIELTQMVNRVRQRADDVFCHHPSRFCSVLLLRRPFRFQPLQLHF